MPDINMTLRLDTNLSQETREAQALNRELSRAQNIANNVRPASQTAAVRSSARPPEGTTAEGLGRGTAAGGGRGDSRDFARQAQGLGGLVHVYATFAANLFAVSAAFNALSKAADVTNMVEGLNQLGAASGKNLGTMAKNLTLITDGAVSLREAMAATAQGNAAGLTGNQMERMAKIAKTASQALGRDMGDALNRLSRGITKIEPELLDELGIMVKVDRAARDYALTLGKTATQLTEFEKRQSFAIAVLEQGEKKFGNIKIDANPYQKLLATFSNLAVAGGELLNKALGPIAKMLGENPGALAAVMAGIGTSLLTRAIPALTQWRANLLKTAEETEAKLKDMKDSFMEFGIQRATPKILEHDENASQAKARALEIAKENSLFKEKSRSMQLLAGGSKELAVVSSQTEIKIKALSKALAEENILLNEAKKNTGADTAQLEAIVAAYNAKLNALRALNAELEIHNKETAAAQKLEDEAGVEGTQDYINQRRLNNAQARAGLSRVSYNVSNNFDSGGIRHAFREISADIDRHNRLVGTAGGQIGRLGSLWAHTTGVMTIGASAVGKVVSAFGNAAAAAAILGVAVAVLDTWLSTNSRQAEEFSGTLDKVSASAKTMSETIDSNVKRGLMDPESIQASANAINEISSSVGALGTKLQKLRESSSVWDEMKDSIFAIFNSGRVGKAVEAAGVGIDAALKGLDPKRRREASAKLGDAAGTADLSVYGITKAFRGLTELEVEGKLKGLGKALEEVSREANNTASSITEVQTAIATADKDMATLMQSYAVNDPFTKMGISFINLAEKIVKGTETAAGSVSNFQALLKDDKKLTLLSPEALKQVFIAKNEFEKFDKSYKEHVARVDSLRKEVNEAAPAYYKTVKYYEDRKGTKGLGNVEDHEVYKAYKQKELNLKHNENNLQAREEEINKELTKVWELTVIGAHKAGAEMISQGMALASAQAANQIAKAYGSISGAGASGAQLELTRRDIAVQEMQITATMALQKTMHENNLLLQIKSSEDQVEKLEKEGKSGTLEHRNLVGEEGDKKGSIAHLKESLALMQSGKKLTMGDLETTEKKAHLMSFVVQQQANYHALIKLAGEKEAAIIKKSIDDASEKNRQEQVILDSSIARNNLAKQEFEILTSTLGSSSTILETARQQIFVEGQNLAIQKESAAWLAEKVKLEIQLAEAEKREPKGGKLTREIKKSLDVGNEQNANKVAQAREKAAADLETFNKASEKRVEAFNQRVLENTRESNALKIEGQISYIELQERELEYQNSIFSLDQKSVAEQKYNLALQKSRLEYSLKTASALEEKEDKSRDLLKDREKLIKGAQELAEEGFQLTAAEQAALEHINAELDLINKKYDNKNDKLREGQTLTEDALARTKQAAVDQATWKPWTDGIKDALTEGLEAGFEKGAVEGGRAFIDSLKRQLKNAALKMIVNAIMNPVTGAIQGFMGQGPNGAAGAGNLMQAGSSLLQGFSTPFVNLGGAVEGIGTALGSEFITSMGVEFAAGAKAGLGVALKGTSVAGVLGAAMPWIAGAVALYSIIGGKRGGPKTEDFFDSTDANKRWGGATSNKEGAAGTLVTGTNKKLSDILRANGIDPGELSGYAASAADPNGTAQTQLDLGISRNGTRLYSRNETYGGIENVGRGEQDLSKAVAKSASEAIIVALSKTDGFTPIVDTFLDGAAAKIKDITTEQATLLAEAVQGKYLEDILKLPKLVNASITEIVQTVELLGPAFGTLADVMKTLGRTTTDAANLATRFTTERTLAAANTYYNAIYTDEEKTAIATEKLNKVFKDAGLIVPKTVEEYRALTDSQNTNTEAGARNSMMLMESSAAWREVTDAAKTSAEEFKNRAKEIFERYATSTQKYARALSDVNTVFKSTADGGKGLGQTLATLNLSIPKNSTEFGELAIQLSNMGAKGKPALDALMSVSDAMDLIANRKQEIADIAAQAKQNIDDTKFNLTLSTKPDAGKYDAYTARYAQVANNLNRDIDSLSMEETSKRVDTLVGLLTTQFNILNDSQKATELSNYLDKLNELDAVISAKAIDESTKLTFDAESTIGAISKSTTQIVEAITKLNPFYEATKDKGTASAVLTTTEANNAKIQAEYSAMLTKMVDDVRNVAVVGGTLTSEASRQTLQRFEETSLGILDGIGKFAIANIPTADTVKQWLQTSTSAGATELGLLTVRSMQQSLDDFIKGGFTDPSIESARVKERELLTLQGANLQQQSNLAQVQSNANNAVANLANGTGNLTQALGALQSLINQLATTAREPATVYVNVQNETKSQVGVFQ